MATSCQVPRIRDLGDTKLYIPNSAIRYDALKPMIGGPLNIKASSCAAESGPD